jgi:hypothetical protein
MYRNTTTRVFLFLSLSFSVLNLQGCVAVPLALAANMATKTSVAKFTVEGKKSAKTAFREAVIQAGGVITSSTDDYSKSEFADVAVKVEIQTTKSGEYQVIGSSNTTVARSWEFKDNITETTQKIVDYLVSNGFKVTASSKS